MDFTTHLNSHLKGHLMTKADRLHCLDLLLYTNLSLVLIRLMLVVGYAMTGGK